MADSDRLLGMYLHLARASRMRQQPLVRDKLLVLAGVQAEEMGLDEISALCRHRILSQNPRHLVGRWPSIGEALGTEPFQAHLKQLKRRYSSEKIEHMIASLGIEMGNERQAYFSDSEYAAALLNTKVEAIAAIVAEDPMRRRKRSSGPNSPEPAPSAPAPSRRKQSRPAPSLAEPTPQTPARNLLIVWAPLVAGRVALAAVAVSSRLID